MQRRRRSQGPAHWKIILALGVLIALGYLIVTQVTGQPRSLVHGLTALDVQEYMENARSLQGNVYKVEGRVEDQLGWSPEGRVLVVLSQGTPVGLKVPAEFSEQNIQTGQSFAFKVRVGRQGILVVEDLEKA